MVGLLLLVLEAVTAILEPFPIAYALDFVTGRVPSLRERGFPAFLTNERVETIVLLGLAIILIAAVNKGADSLSEVFLARGGRELGYNIRVTMYDRLQRLSMAFHDKRRTGDVLTRVTGDVLVVEEFVVDSVSNFVASALLLIGSFVALLLRSWQVALIAVVVVPVLALVANHFSLRLKRFSKEQRAKEGDLASTAQEMLSSIRLVQSYGRGHVDLQNFSRQSDQSMRASLRIATVQAQFSFAIAVFEGADDRRRRVAQLLARRERRDHPGHARAVRAPHPEHVQAVPQDRQRVVPGSASSSPAPSASPSCSSGSPTVEDTPGRRSRRRDSRAG